MNDSAPPASLLPTIRLGIQGLPNLTDSMLGGGLYVVIAATPPARFPILAASLGAALANGRSCSVILPANPELFLARMDSFAQFDGAAAIAENRLALFETQPEFPKKMFRFGADSFVGELDHFGIPPNSYLVFDQADELLSLHDVSLALDQLDILHKWFALRGVTALLILTRVSEAQSGAINALMDNLTGLAHLGGDRDGLQLTFHYWQSPEGTIAARNYRMARLENGLYEASTGLATQDAPGADEATAARQEADDSVQHYFYMDPDLAGLARQMSGVWQYVDTLVGMLHATRNTRSAVSILNFDRSTSLRQLAEAVHTLRLSLGRRARIVVQEKDASLRYQNEALLLRLGLNLVVHRDVPVSRLPLLLESLNGQRFERDVDINFEAALGSVLPTRLRGYVAPLRFSREVELVLERAETLAIPCAMIIGTPQADRSMVDMIAASGMSRPGDLVSSDGQRCYLFLNACPQSVMLVTLERILGMPVDTAFAEVHFLIQRAEIQAALAALSRAARDGALPDYSSALGSVVPDEAEPDQAPEVPPVAGAPLAPERIPLVARQKDAAIEAANPAGVPHPVAGGDQTFGKQQVPRATRSAAPQR